MGTRERLRGGEMTARDAAKEMLVEEGFQPSEMDDVWLTPSGIAFLVAGCRRRRAGALRTSGMVETPRSERAARMISALLAVGGA